MRSLAPRPAHRSFADPFDTTFFRFFLFCIAFGSLYYSFLFLLSFLISHYSSLLILLFLPRLILLVGAILRLLIILLFLYFKLFVVLQTCILMILYLSLRGFPGSQAFLNHLGPTLMYIRVRPYVLTFLFCPFLLFFIFSSWYSLRILLFFFISTYSSLLTLLFISLLILLVLYSSSSYSSILIFKLLVFSY